MAKKYDHVGSAHVFKQRRENKNWVWGAAAVAVVILLIVA